MPPFRRRAWAEQHPAYDSHHVPLHVSVGSALENSGWLNMLDLAVSVLSLYSVCSYIAGTYTRTDKLGDYDFRKVGGRGACAAGGSAAGQAGALRRGAGQQEHWAAGALGSRGTVQQGRWEAGALGRRGAGQQAGALLRCAGALRPEPATLASWPLPRAP